ncbi:MAG TPA: MBL fold metallo-hydrolase [Syntrophorhabdaceae bacterium]|nr:MBL fold metallo-hydrolase [Syntrophorhabdaceae bacterium]HOD74761.1 MBL fold metallo-hydrolase [Syntrophorhabdaceae bacterium]
MGETIRQGFCALPILMLCLVVSCCVTPTGFDEGAWRKKVEAARAADLYAPHYKDGKYFNPWMPMEEKGFLRFLKWKLSPSGEYTAEERRFLPSFIPGAAERIEAMPEGDLILWVGHATFLIRLGSRFWLTDPILSDRALLPRRKISPAMTPGELKRLGSPGLNVIISHNHYDHLDKQTLESLPDNTRFFVPLGMKEFLMNLGKKDVIEMDWWQSVDAGDGTTVVCLPAQHWSRRIGQAVNSTLWASFLMISPKNTVYYGGDSGYFIGFREIGRRYPGIDYALIPVTAYHPRWFMHYAHMDIDECIDAFDDLGARYFVPTQWGTFHLGDDPPGLPALDLKRRIAVRDLDPSRFLIMDIGEILPLSGKTE